MEYISSILPSLLKGAGETVKLFFLRPSVCITLGVAHRIGSDIPLLPLRFLAKTYVWIFRGTPLLLQLFFVCYGLPILFGDFFLLPRMTAAVITFVLNYAAYFAEIYRSGIQSIDRGQHEAAHTLDFSPWQTMRLVILPQALARIIPLVSNEIIILVKDTALATSIGVAELLKAAKDANNRDVNPASFLIAAIIYLILTFGLTMLSQYLEKRFTRKKKPTIS